MIIFIGGASASGKSTTVEKFGSSVHIIKLDCIYNRIVKMFKNGHADDQNAQIARCTMKKAAKELLVTSLGQRLEYPVIMEGGWIEPDQARGIWEHFSNDTFCPIYCGYPYSYCTEESAWKNEIKDRYNRMKQTKKHWTITRMHEEEAQEWLCKESRHSRKIEAQCKEYGFEFVNFSCFSSGNKELIEYLNAKLSLSVSP